MSHDQSLNCGLGAHCSWLFLLMFPQLPHQTVCMNNDPIDTQSASTTQSTTVNHAPAPTGQFTVNASPAPSFHALTQSHRHAAGPVKVQILNSKGNNSQLNRNNWWQKTPCFKVSFEAFFAIFCVKCSFLLQAAYMRVESELMGRRGMTYQTHVLCVCVMKALSGVRESAVRPQTVITLSRDSVACPVMVSDWKTASFIRVGLRKNLIWSQIISISHFSTCRLHVQW